MSSKSLGFAVICALALIGSVSAHHSHGNYESTFIDIQGTVTEVHLINPHSWVYIEVDEGNGEKTAWALEATGRSGLARIGVTADYISPGDEVKVRCHQLRDGGNGCLMGFLQGRDGSIKDWDGHESMPEDDGFFDID